MGSEYCIQAERIFLPGTCNQSRRSAYALPLKQRLPHAKCGSLVCHAVAPLFLVPVVVVVPVTMTAPVVPIPVVAIPIIAAPVTEIVAIAPTAPVCTIAEHEAVRDINVRPIEPHVVAIATPRRREVMLEIPPAGPVIIVAIINRPANSDG